MKNHHFMRRMAACELRNEEYRQRWRWRRHQHGLWQSHSSYNCAENRYVYILCNCIFPEYLMKHCAAHRFCTIFHLSSCSSFFCFLTPFFIVYTLVQPRLCFSLLIYLSLVQFVNNERFASYFIRIEEPHVARVSSKQSQDEEKNLNSINRTGHRIENCFSK